ncbi:hypothetical protein KC340_g10494 [Hortaea werneckii]|nr:hypothetical protein KC339_g2500 [Hortaea werneckii]KAI7231050.1 hypothetical protein KC365_g7376 [Hortaea werneckii]KAI7310446.1 hypothetical protein KC340_g10494 [Hortaea werneckii]KAI7407452.1 hypothetical protein KC328_g511 [Hortaea werneckii]
MSSSEVSTIGQELKRVNFNTPQPQDDQQTQQVTTVDTKDKVVPMLQVLTSLESSSNSVFVDMEGVNLSRHGSISLIQIYVPQCKEIFIVDIHTLGAQAFEIPGHKHQTLKSVLEGSEIKKHFFDVRNDADALYALFNIRLAHVVDVQLLELASRTGSKHVLRGLAACIEQEQVLTEATAYKWKRTKEEGTKLFNPKIGGSYEVFNVRPLPQALVDYCVGDVQHLPGLSNVYQCRLNDSWRDQVRVETERRLTESRRPDYQPKGKKKIFGPRRWAFPPKSQAKLSKEKAHGAHNESSLDVYPRDAVLSTV